MNSVIHGTNSVIHGMNSVIHEIAYVKRGIPSAVQLRRLHCSSAAANTFPPEVGWFGIPKAHELGSIIYVSVCVCKC